MLCDEPCQGRGGRTIRLLLVDEVERIFDLFVIRVETLRILDRLAVVDIRRQIDFIDRRILSLGYRITRRRPVRDRHQLDRRLRQAGSAQALHQAGMDRLR